MNAQYIEDAWVPTAENVNAMPFGLRQYILDLATRYESEGDVAEITLLKDE